MCSIDDLLLVCDRHVLPLEVKAVIPEPYVPYIPGLTRPGTWNGVLVLGEAQNLSKTHGEYLARLRHSTRRDRMLRLHWETEIHVRPWDDGTLKLAMVAGFGANADEFAVSNAILWSAGDSSERNEKPSSELCERSVAIWKEMLPRLAPRVVLTTGRTAGSVIAAVNRNSKAPWVHIELCSASPQFLAKPASKVLEHDLLTRYPTVAQVARVHPNYAEKYSKHKLYFASQAVEAIRKRFPGNRMDPPAARGHCGCSGVRE